MLFAEVGMWRIFEEIFVWHDLIVPYLVQCSAVSTLSAELAEHPDSHHWGTILPAEETHKPHNVDFLTFFIKLSSSVTMLQINNRFETVCSVVPAAIA